jgi:hypothetical protein
VVKVDIVNNASALANQDSLAVACRGSSAPVYHSVWTLHYYSKPTWVEATPAMVDAVNIHAADISTKRLRVLAGACGAKGGREALKRLLKAGRRD